MLWPVFRKVERIKNVKTVNVYKNAIHFPDKEVEKLISFAKKNARPIFNPDKRRLQCSLSKNSSTGQKIIQSLTNFNLLNERYVGGMVVIHSKEECKQQQWHTDYNPEKLKKLSVKPLGVIIALQDNTLFEVPFSTFIINKGDMLCFEGDTVHAGAKYDIENTRIHIYLDIKNVIREKNRTWYVDV